jgi:hypothetical protein
MKLAIGRAFRALKPQGILIASEPGVGHAKRSREFVREWGVTDKDTPPSLVCAMGRAVGFSVCNTYPHAETLGPALYSSKPGPMAWVGRLLRILHHTTLARRNGLVVLVK